MIRFQRVGRRNDPAFRLVVIEKRSKPKSGAIEILGSFHPKTKAAVFKKERVLYWISKGAGLSSRAHNLLVSKGVVSGKKKTVVPPSKFKPVSTETLTVETRNPDTGGASVNNNTTPKV